MKNINTSTTFSKSLLAGFLVGIIVALLNLIYTIAFRESKDFDADMIIMPLTIFIGFPILMVMAGSAYYLLQKHLLSGTTWFVTFCMIGMITLLIVTILDTRAHQGAVFAGARGLFLGMVIITFLPSAFLIPYLAKHPGIFL